MAIATYHTITPIATSFINSFLFSNKDININMIMTLHVEALISVINILLSNKITFRFSI